MSHKLLAPAAMATLFCLITTAVLAQSSAQTATQTPGAMSAEQGWSSVARCAQEDSERARHACLDRVLREAGLLTNEMHARQQRKAFGLEDKPARVPTPPSAASAPPPATASTAAPAEKPSNAGRLEEPAAAPSRPATEGSSPTAPPAQPDRLEVELTAVKKSLDGRLLVTTNDGAVWLQTESVEMPQPPVAGDRMTIRKGSMGGYRCSVARTNLTYRCARSR